MGMYTEFHYNIELPKKTTPKEVIKILKYMINNEKKIDDIEIPEHKLFKTDRWTYMLRTDSYYFSADTKSTLRYDKIGECYYLCIRCNLKNYDNEIEKFIDWINPYIGEYDDFLGFYRYEESNKPTLIYKKE